MLKAKSSKKFSKSKNLRNFALLGALEIRGYEKLWFLLQKAHPCMNARRLSHFASKSVAGSDLQAWAGKSQKVSDSHRNDVSPLTQGLRYRAACDVKDNWVDLGQTASTLGQVSKSQNLTQRAKLQRMITCVWRHSVPDAYTNTVYFYCRLLVDTLAHILRWHW